MKTSAPNYHLEKVVLDHPKRTIEPMVEYWGQTVVSTSSVSRDRVIAKGGSPRVQKRLLNRHSVDCMMAPDPIGVIPSIPASTVMGDRVRQ